MRERNGTGEGWKEKWEKGKRGEKEEDAKGKKKGKIMEGEGIGKREGGKV